MDLGKKDAALTATETKLETLKAHQANQQEHIAVLQTSLTTKEHHIKNLQSEVSMPHMGNVIKTVSARYSSSECKNKSNQRNTHGTKTFKRKLAII